MKTFPMNILEVYACGSAHAISDGVIFTDPLYGRDNLEAYVDADMYVLPSIYDMFPMTVLEAMVCGTPIILSKNCGFSDVVRDKAGLVAEPVPAEIERVMLKILINQKLRQEFSENCLKTAKQFSMFYCIATTGNIQPSNKSSVIF